MEDSPLHAHDRTQLLVALATVLPTLLVAAAIARPFSDAKRPMEVLVRLAYVALALVGLACALSGIVGDPAVWKCSAAALATSAVTGAIFFGFVNDQLASALEQLSGFPRLMFLGTAWLLSVGAFATPLVFVGLSLIGPLEW